MSLATLDALSEGGGTRFRDLAAAEPAELPLLLIGMGWAQARLRRPARAPAGAGTRGWFVADGYGFFQAFFRWRTLVSGAAAKAVGGDALRAFEQGVGRALWFLECADVAAVVAAAGAFPSAHPGDLWSGVGFAAAYAGGAEPDSLRDLVSAAGERRWALGTGAALAAWVAARERVRLAPKELLTLVGLDQPGAADLAQAAFKGSRRAPGETAAAAWRRSLGDALAGGRGHS